MGISGFCSSVARTIGHFGSPKIIGGLSAAILGSCFLSETPAVTRVRNYALGMLAVSALVYRAKKYFGSSNPSPAVQSKPFEQPAAQPLPILPTATVIPSALKPAPSKSPVAPTAPPSSAAPKAPIPLPENFITTDYVDGTRIKYTPGSFTIHQDQITKSSGDECFKKNIKESYMNAVSSAKTPIILIKPLGIDYQSDSTNPEEDFKHNDGLTFKEGVELAYETISSFPNKKDKRVVLLFDNFSEKQNADTVISNWIAVNKLGPIDER